MRSLQKGIPLEVIYVKASFPSEGNIVPIRMFSFGRNMMFTEEL